VERIAHVDAAPKADRDVDALIAHRAKFLEDYQDARWADRYRALVARVRSAEQSVGAADSPLSAAVAESYFKLMSYKDEYEVARLYTNGAFEAEIAEHFEGPYRLRFHLAPPLFAPRDPVNGHLRKLEFGGWMLGAFRVLARCKRLRGTRLDPFGYTAERRFERSLIVEYESTIATLLERLARDNAALAAEIARLPLSMRGFGHVKEAAVARARKRRDELLARYRGERTSPVKIVTPA
jgi:indolepyruvate ferredoxin oxidoreductase